MIDPAARPVSYSLEAMSIPVSHAEVLKIKNDVESTAAEISRDEMTKGMTESIKNQYFMEIQGCKSEIIQAVDAWKMAGRSFEFIQMKVQEMIASFSQIRERMLLNSAKIKESVRCVSDRMQACSKSLQPSSWEPDRAIQEARCRKLAEQLKGCHFKSSEIKPIVDRCNQVEQDAIARKKELKESSRKFKEQTKTAVDIATQVGSGAAGAYGIEKLAKAASKTPKINLILLGVGAGAYLGGQIRAWFNGEEAEQGEESKVEGKE